MTLGFHAAVLFAAVQIACAGPEEERFPGLALIEEPVEPRLGVRGRSPDEVEERLGRDPGRASVVNARRHARVKPSRKSEDAHGTTDTKIARSSSRMASRYAATIAQ